VLRPEIFEWMRVGEELVQEPFQRLAAAGKLLSYSYDGSGRAWTRSRTKQLLEDLTRAARCRGSVENTKPPAGAR